MSWKMVGKPRSVKVTHDLAQSFASMTPAKGDRPLRAQRAAKIRHLFSTDQFRTCEWASAKCVEDGVIYRVNGKHTSTMLAEMNGSMPSDLYVTIQEYECETLDDVARLYATFDSAMSLRGTGDINRAFSGCIEDFADIPARTINAAVTGMAFEKWEDSYTRYPTEERAAMLLTNGAFIVWLHNLVGDYTKESKPLRRGPVVAAMFRTWKKNHKAATEFWSLVRDESSADNKSADRHLARYLRDHSIANGRGAGAGLQRAGQREFYVKCLHAWNAWRKGVTTNLKYYQSAETPKAV